jgi:hypothetical protein
MLAWDLIVETAKHDHLWCENWCFEWTAFRKNDLVISCQFDREPFVASNDEVVGSSFSSFDNSYKQLFSPTTTGL